MYSLTTDPGIGTSKPYLMGKYSANHHAMAQVSIPALRQRRISSTATIGKTIGSLTAANIPTTTPQTSLKNSTT